VSPLYNLRKQIIRISLFQPLILAVLVTAGLYLLIPKLEAQFRDIIIMAFSAILFFEFFVLYLLLKASGGWKTISSALETSDLHKLAERLQILRSINITLGIMSLGSVIALLLLILIE
jgi:hypothetical protein